MLHRILAVLFVLLIADTAHSNECRDVIRGVVDGPKLRKCIGVIYESLTWHDVTNRTGEFETECEYRIKRDQKNDPQTCYADWIEALKIRCAHHYERHWTVHNHRRHIAIEFTSPTPGINIDVLVERRCAPN